MKKTVSFLLTAVLLIAALGAVQAVSAETAQGKSLMLYSKELGITNNWWEGNMIDGPLFDKPEEGDWKISQDYTYIAFDIVVPNNVQLVVSIKQSKSWLFWKPIPGAPYYHKAQGSDKYTQTSVNADGEIELADFTGGIALPFTSMEQKETTGYTIYDLYTDSIIFHNNAGEGGHWDCKVKNIMFADQDYLFPSVEGEANYIKLNQTISEAESLVSSATASADGTDVAKGHYWVPQETMTSLTDALTAAKALEPAGTATQAEVDLADNELKAAIDSFIAARKEGTMESAEYGLIRSTFEISQHGAYVTSYDGGFISKMETFSKVKFTVDASAQTAAVNLSVGFNCLEWGQDFRLSYSAAADINGADAENQGSGFGYTRADRYYWLQADGETLATRYSIETVDNLGEQHETGYVTLPAGFKGTVIIPYTAFRPIYTGYMSAAGGPLKNFGINVKEEGVKLTAANVRLVNETVSETLNKNNLTAAIAEAKKLAGETVVDTDGSNTSITTNWISQAGMDALQEAIEAAEAALAAATDVSHQQAVDSATQALKTAMTTFEDSRADGTKDYFAVLAEKIAAAEALLNGTEISTTANEVAVDQYWVTADVAAALNSAANAAKAVKNTASHQEFVQAEEDLAQAISAFETARKPGALNPDGTVGGDNPGCGSASFFSLLLFAGLAVLKRKF